ncbi:MAG: TFIIB-type zinc ribbon-containing protein [Promethearchaeia archaeon]
MSRDINITDSECEHKNIIHEGGYTVCQDCGLILNDLDFEDGASDKFTYYGDSQLDYEKKIKKDDSIALQDPKIKEKYNKIQMLEKWYKDSKSNFAEQKRTIEKLKSFGIGLEIDNAKFQNIKKRYLRYNRRARKTYQNMVIIFLALIWDEIKDTTNIRLDKFIEVCRNELGHKINKKMLNNAMLKIKKAEEKWRLQKAKSRKEIENKIKKDIKILFEKDLNNIPFEKVKKYFKNPEEFEKLKIQMILRLNDILDKIEYKYLQSVNLKAFVSGLIYYIGQTLPNKRIFTQNIIEEVTGFSSTTIRKKYKLIKSILGN